MLHSPFQHFFRKGWDFSGLDRADVRFVIVPIHSEIFGVAYTGLRSTGQFDYCLDCKVRNLGKFRIFPHSIGAHDPLCGNDGLAGSPGHENILERGAEDPGISVNISLLNVNDGVIGHECLNAYNFLAVERAFHDLKKLGPVRHKIASPHSTDRHERNSVSSRTESMDHCGSGALDCPPRSVFFHRFSHPGSESSFIFQSEKTKIGCVGLQCGEQVIGCNSERRSTDPEPLDGSSGEFKTKEAWVAVHGISANSQQHAVLD